MNEFFPTDDNNEEEDVDMKEDSEGLETKGLSPPYKKSKAKKLGNSKDSSEDENGSEEKQRTEEMEGQSQEADDVNTATVTSTASEEALEVCKDEDSIKDDDTKKDEVADHSVHDQDYPNGNGKENDSIKNEVKIETESHSSYMETEELPSIQEDARMVEQPEVILIADDREEKGSETAQDKDTPRVPVKNEGSSDTENASCPDVEMNNQVDSINDSTESQQED